jgi:5'/3'-nucleotidase SurE
MDKCVQIVTVQGTPATAVNIALEHIRPFPIQLVVSGPNVGQNAGSSFIGCSGTVGAALEATIQGVPAVAISFAYSNPVFDEREVQVACRIAVRVIKEIWEKWSAGEFKSGNVQC